MDNTTMQSINKVHGNASKQLGNQNARKQSTANTSISTRCSTEEKEFWAWWSNQLGFQDTSKYMRSLMPVMPGNWRDMQRGVEQNQEDS